MLPQWRSHWRLSLGLFCSNGSRISTLTSYSPLQSYFFLGRLQALWFSRTGKYQAGSMCSYLSGIALLMLLHRTYSS